MLTRAHTLSIVDILRENPQYEAPWERAIDYLASHAGRWVPGWELADAVYGGHCSRAAVPMLISRARRHFRIESDRNLGYRIGRHDVQAAMCPKCSTRRVRYSDEWVCYGCPGTGAADLEVGRTPYAEGSRAGKQWTDEEWQTVTEFMDVENYEQIADRLNRTPNGVRGEVKKQGLSKPYVRTRE